MLLGLITGCTGSSSAALNDDLLYAATPSNLLSDAVEIVSGDCMTAQGFTYVARQDERFEAPNLMSMAYLQDDVNFAMENGFAQASVPLPDEQGREFVERLFGPEGGPSVELELSTGMLVSVPAEGCLSKALEAVYASQLNYLKVSNFVNEVTFVRPPATGAAYVQVSEDYGTCMEKRGLQEIRGFEDLARVIQDEFANKRDASGEIGAREAEVALSDASCQSLVSARTRLNDYFLQTNAKWISANSSQIQSVAALKREAEARALTIVAEPQSR